MIQFWIAKVFALQLTDQINEYKCQQHLPTVFIEYYSNSHAEELFNVMHLTVLFWKSC